jgi:hypothetical protein
MIMERNSSSQNRHIITPAVVHRAAPNIEGKEHVGGEAARMSLFISPPSYNVEMNIAMHKDREMLSLLGRNFLHNWQEVDFAGKCAA